MLKIKNVLPILVVMLAVVSVFAIKQPKAATIVDEVWQFSPNPLASDPDDPTDPLNYVLVSEDFLGSCDDEPEMVCAIIAPQQSTAVRPDIAAVSGLSTRIQQLNTTNIPQDVYVKSAED